MATWLGRTSLCHWTGSMPTRPSRWLTRPNCVAEEVAEDQGDGDGGDDVGQQDAHPPEGPGPQAAVEGGGDEQRRDDLRHAREQEDADGVLQRVPEVGLREHVGVVLEADEVALAADEAPLVERDPRRVEQREEPDDAEEDEERRDVRVGRGLLVELRQASPPPDRGFIGERCTKAGMAVPRGSSRARRHPGAGPGAVRGLDGHGWSARRVDGPVPVRVHRAVHWSAGRAGWGGRLSVSRGP